MDNIELNLAKYRGDNSSIFTGRPQGILARQDLKLDDKDSEEEINYTFVIPDGTTSFNPSFYLGLLYQSYKRLGLTNFNSKYHFRIDIADPETKVVINNNLMDGHRNAINELERKTGLWKFIKKQKR